MDGNGSPELSGDKVVQTAHVFLDGRTDAAEALARRLGPGPFALIAVFATPRADLAGLTGRIGQRFPAASVVGCTTAGEISGQGYAEDGIVAIALPQAHFTVDVLLFDDLHLRENQDVIGDIIRARARAALGVAAPDMEHEFAFLMIDGLSRKEDEMASSISSGLGGVPLFGGSAGDGIRFERTLIAVDGTVYRNAAALTLVRSHCPVRVFTLNHFTPTDQRMVVTSADPSRRIVRSINAEPAARELGRILGKDSDQIDTFTFAGNPVVVRFGGQHHVRAIKRVTSEGHLEFFSAIDEGLVLTLADAQDMVSHLDETLGAMTTRATGEVPDAIIACDCVLRRIEAEQKQITRELSDVLARHNVAGFSTYGEQINSMHVNQTMTGVAIYPPEERDG